MRAGRGLAAALRAARDARGWGLRSVHLCGPLGAGKTTLVRGLLRGLGYRSSVKSPTYTLVEPYELEGRCLYHFDLYRLASPLELEEFGVRDYFHEGALCVVEWPERGAGALPGPDLICDLRVSGGGRVLRVREESARGRSLLAAWKEPFR